MYFFIYIFLFIQLIIPISIRIYIYDPLFDIYIKTCPGLYSLLSNPNEILRKSHLYELDNKFPIDKERVLELLKSTNTDIYPIITYFSDKIDNIELIKSDANPLLFLFSIIFSLTNKVENKHDGIVPINTMLGCSDITIDDSIFMDIKEDEEVREKLGNKLHLQAYLVDHLSVIGVGDNIHTDKIIWTNILDILNDRFD
jgi:hypothetical protein